MTNRPTREIAKGNWRGILMQMGIPEKMLVNRHGPCPLCDGKDRFRFDNKEGSGSWICSKCGAGDGFELAERFTGKSFAEVARLVEQICGMSDLPADKIRPAISEEERKAALRRLIKESSKVTAGDVVDRYLTSRGIGEVTYPPALRFAPSIQDGEGGVSPAMLAVVQAKDGANVTIHRTFLDRSGSGKARITSPRKLMPGPFPEGSAVRLSDWTGGPLGIAEGIETAMAASALFRVPVWSAINAGQLARWSPPQGCTEVEVFGDWDLSFTGQAAAYQLARKLALDGLEVTVRIPEPPGYWDQKSYDWLDEYQRQKALRGVKAA